MSALTTIFNYLLAYIIAFLYFVLGLDLSHFVSGTVSEILGEIEFNFIELFSEEQIDIIISIRPILYLSIGIFSVGSIICLIHRLMK